MSDWQPIETCPGNKFVWLVNDDPEDHELYLRERNFLVNIRPYRGKKLWRHDGILFAYFNDSDERVIPDPTRWMAIEPPPAPWEERSKWMDRESLPGDEKKLHELYDELETATEGAVPERKDLSLRDIEKLTINEVLVLQAASLARIEKRLDLASDNRRAAEALLSQSKRLLRIEEEVSTIREQCYASAQSVIANLRPQLVRIEGYVDFIEKRTRAKRDLDNPAFTAGKSIPPR